MVRPHPSSDLNNFASELTMSSTVSEAPAKALSPAKEAKSIEAIKSVEVTDEYKDAEKNFQPKSLKFWTIISGVYLSIFLVALVLALPHNPTREDLD